MPASLRIALEGHGREELVEGVDLAATVGWFTALYPIRLPVRQDGDAIAAVARIKDRLRLVPDGGVGYGLLRWLGEDDTAERAGVRPGALIAFNYLGQVDGSFAAEGPFTLAPEAVGDTIDPQAPRRHAVELVAAVVGGRLTLRWIHVPGLHAGDTIEALANRFAAAVERLSAVDEAEARAAWTPSDFPLAGFAPTRRRSGLGRDARRRRYRRPVPADAGAGRHAVPHRGLR